MTHASWIGAAVFATAAAGMTLGAPSSAQARDEGPRVQAHERDGGHPVGRAYPRAEARGELRGPFGEEGEPHGEFRGPYGGEAGRHGEFRGPYGEGAEHHGQFGRPGGEEGEPHGEFRGHEELHGYGEFGEHHHHDGLGLGFYWAPYWTGSALWGPWGEYWGPSYPEDGPSLSQALIEGYGAVDMDVRPGRAEVWVDGRYVAEARDLDGSPSYLWLTAGDHEVEIYRDGYVTFTGDVEVRPGAITPMRVDLVRGFSEPPGE
jgi:hypothetical protein